MAVSVLLPTRGRPDNVRRLVESARRTAELPPEFVIYVDDDDPASADVGYELDTTVVAGPRVVLSEMWNTCAGHATREVVMHCGDDIIFQTYGWDVAVISTFSNYPDRLVLVHGRDGFQDERLATHGFYHRNWIDTLGYLVPPYFSSDYNDLWNTEIADAIGRRVYLSDVYTEHMHPVNGKAPLDQTHRERLERHERDNVAQLYKELANLRQRDVTKLQTAITDRRYVT